MNKPHPTGNHVGGHVGVGHVQHEDQPVLLEHDVNVVPTSKAGRVRKIRECVCSSFASFAAAKECLCFMLANAFSFLDYERVNN